MNYQRNAVLSLVFVAARVEDLVGWQALPAPPGGGSNYRREALPVQRFRFAVIANMKQHSLFPPDVDHTKVKPNPVRSIVGVGSNCQDPFMPIDPFCVPEISALKVAVKNQVALQLVRLIGLYISLLPPPVTARRGKRLLHQTKS